MRNYHNRSSFFYRIKRIFNLFRGDGVQTCRWFIKENNGWIFQEQSGDGNSLLLTAGKLRGVVVVSFRQIICSWR